MGYDRRGWHRHPRVRRLSLPHGPVLLGTSCRSGPTLGGPAALAGINPLRRRHRCRLPLPSNQPHRTSSPRRWPPLHAVAVSPPVRRSYLGHSLAVGWPSVVARLHHAGAASWRLALPRTLCSRRSHGQLDQRLLDHLRGSRSRPVDSVCSLRPTLGLSSAGTHHHRADRCADSGGQHLVDRRSRHRSRLRRKRPQVHRDRLRHLRQLECRRDYSGTRLLVLLWFRSPWTMDRVLGCLHPASPCADPVLRAAIACAGCRCLLSLEAPCVLHPPDCCRHDVVRGGTPLRQPDTLRWTAQDLHDHYDCRSRHALDRSSHSSGDPRTRRPARGRPLRAVAEVSKSFGARCPALHRDHPGERRSDCPRRHHRQQFLSTRSPPSVRAGGHRVSQ